MGGLVLMEGPRHAIRDDFFNIKFVFVVEVSVYLVILVDKIVSDIAHLLPYIREQDNLLRVFLFFVRKNRNRYHIKLDFDQIAAGVEPKYLSN